MRIFVLVLALLQFAMVKAQPPEDIIEYISRYKRLAMQEMQRTGIPAALKLAQGIHETSAGKSVLVLKSNNHFGIKCKPTWTGKRVYHDDDSQGECFRSYNSPMDSYRDHSNFLMSSDRYSFLFKLDPTDYKGWAIGLRKAGYATNPNYAPIIIRIIEDYNLEQYTLIALGRMSPEDEVMATAPGTENVATPEDLPVPVPFPGQPGRDTISARDKAIMDALVVIREQAAKQQADSGLRMPLETVAVAPVVYPEGTFSVNNTQVVFAKQGTTLLSLAKDYDVSLKRLFEFNDMKEQDVLPKDQLVYLQRKRKTGKSEFHVVAPGESKYDVSQAEGIRLESLLEYNSLQPYMEPADGEKLYLKSKSAARPLLRGEVAALNKTAAIEGQPVIERATLHVVQPTETLYSISKKYGVERDKIREWNKMDGSDVKVGQQLVIYKN
ncbi:MAG: glucosaminidase domain-containing protein [Flavitalea sp.]